MSDIPIRGVSGQRSPTGGIVSQENMAAARGVVAGNNDGNARQAVEPRPRVVRGTVASRAVQTVAVPPPRQIDGAGLLCDVHDALERFAVWPKEAALVTACLYAGHAHGQSGKPRTPIWQYSPRLYFTANAAEGGSGKSWMARLVGKLCPDGKMMVEPNKQNLVRLIEERATPVVTELDILLNTGGRNKWFTGIANAGYQPDVDYSRVQNGKRVDIPMQCPMILDGLESLMKSSGTDLKTLFSRCIIIRVETAPEGYRPPRFDNKVRAAFRYGSELLGEWMGQQVKDGIEDYIPDVPPWLGNRAAALWEPLFAVADAAGGEWPKWARMACTDLEHGGDSWAPEEDGVSADQREAAWRAALAEWRTSGAPAAGTETEKAEETEAFVDA